MDEYSFYKIILVISLTLAAATFITLFFVTAPYGRHARAGWGRLIPNRLGWVIMEAPSPLVMLGMYLTGGEASRSAAAIVLLLMWMAHYIHRAFIYPFTIWDGKKKMPLVVMCLGFVFNLGNAYINGRWLFHFAGERYGLTWLRDPRFLVGTGLFVAGYITNRWADDVLHSLRHPGETGYRIPQRGLYRYISCPNYLGEIIEWVGWAVATWSLAGLAFAAWTFANLAPRAVIHHRWYRKMFAEYPAERKALIPWVW